MKTQTQFKNASLVSVVNGSIVVKDSTGREHTYVNASVVSVNNGTIIIESEWKPKKGELIKFTWEGDIRYGIFQEICSGLLWTYGCSMKSLSEFFHAIDNPKCRPMVHTNIYPVTPEEQKEFDDFCKSQGMLWNKKTLQWEKYKWEPKVDEKYYFIDLVGRITAAINNTVTIDAPRIKYGNCFQTEEQAKEAAEKVKELLKSL